MKEYIVLIDEVVDSIIDVSNYLDDKNNIINILQGLFPGKKIIKKNKNHGSIATGYYYINNNFIQPKPFKSWILKNNKWHPPKNYPKDNKTYYWDEDSISWKTTIDGGGGIK